MERRLDKATRNAQILVVDDDPAMVKLLGTLFEEEGLKVILATSVGEAKAALAAHNWAFDLVLSDISMPGESGFDLLQWIKQADSPHPELPVLLTTAQLPEAENRVKGLAMGAVDYVVRPVELSELVIRALHAIEHFQRLRSLEASLQNSENLAMVGRLLAASHHEIKNLATLVNLATEQAIKHFEPQLQGVDSRGQVALKTLSQASTLLTDVAKSVANLLDPEVTHSQPVAAAQLVAEVVELMASRVSPCRIEFLRAKNDNSVWVLGHAVRLKQVLINLILNAADAIQELEPPEGGYIAISLTRDDDSCQINVKDNGIGFSAPEERTEFKPFSTTKRLRGGQGLGLWLCGTLMQNVGGKLSLASTGVGLGACAVMSMRRTDRDPCDDLDIQSYLSELNDLVPSD